MSIKIFVSDWSWSGVRQRFNTTVQNLKCMMDKINISLSGVNRLQWKCVKEVTDVLEGQLLYEFFTEGDIDPSVEQKRKYAAMTNLRAESYFTALDSNFCWLGVSSNLQTICSKSFG